MTTVWIVEQGEYSDYRVVGIFSTRAHAKTVADAINVAEDYFKASVAERALDPAVHELNAGLQRWRVLMLVDGTVERCEPESLSGYDLEGDVTIWHRSRVPAYRDRGIADVLQGSFWGRDQEHAIKIANEHRAQLIAAGKFK